MVAVRNLLSTLNNLAHAGLLATGRLRLPEAVSAGGAFARPMAGRRTCEGGVEPPLEELLDDPVVRLMMRADHLEPEEVRRLLTSGQRPGVELLASRRHLQRVAYHGFRGTL